eukprot:scaffold317_cov260-Pinguiococcus_pyrenoidosus.AAC.40
MTNESPCLHDHPLAPLRHVDETRHARSRRPRTKENLEFHRDAVNSSVTRTKGPGATKPPACAAQSIGASLGSEAQIRRWRTRMSVCHAQNRPELNFWSRRSAPDGVVDPESV